MRKGLLLIVAIGMVLILGKKFDFWLVNEGREWQDAAVKDQVTSVEDRVAEASMALSPNPNDILVLVNKQSAITSEHVPQDLTKVKVPFSFVSDNEEQMMRQEAAKALEKMFEAAENEQIRLIAVSGYRSYESQKALCDQYVQTRGEKYAARYCAQPGTSEHQTGLAMDIGSAVATEPLGDKFGDTAEGQWVAKHAAEFGFIIRYPKGKEEITGYAYEPWHLRYVGIETATVIMDQGITLEEYFMEHNKL